MSRTTRRTPREALAAKLRVAGAAMAATGLAALMAVSVSGAALAGAPAGYNQITGAGDTASAITVNWTKGLLGSDNKPLTPAQETQAGDQLSTNEDRSSASPTSALSFMYQDFQRLQVTVSQTADIRHQGITVQWTGEGHDPAGTGTTVTDNTAAADFLQIMECYGDASTGPTPEQCEYGTPGLLATGNIDNPFIGQRTGDICNPNSVPSTDLAGGKTPTSLNGDNAVWGCDTKEPVTTDTAPHLLPPCTTATEATCAQGVYSIPFVPADDPNNPGQPGKPVYQADLTQYFGQSDSNEIQQTVSNDKGAGQVQFEALTGVQSQGLGCGETETNGQVRGCWLVIVPRGEFEPNGYPLTTSSTSSNGYLNTTPLAASNWAQRIQVHLGYAPEGSFCALGTPVTQTEGTELIDRAMLSWTLALAQKDNCAATFNNVENNEAGVTADLKSSSTSGVGLGFTTIPIGSETTEDGKPPATVPNVLYAPVAVTALGFAFNINDDRNAGFITTSMKLTPMLLAKALTQVYLRDLPDYYPPDKILPTDGGKTTALQKNPADIAEDQEFINLNPASKPLISATVPLAPLLVTGKSNVNQQVWQWVNSDSTASGWLDGTTTDKQYGIVADPDYVSNRPQLGKFPAPTFPRDYQGVLDSTSDPKIPATASGRDSGLLLPEVDSFDLTASDVLVASNPGVGGWDPNIQDPHGHNGYWDSLALQAIGQRFIWSLSDTPSMAAYGLVPASLCSGDGPDGKGANCVSLSEASITAALATAKADSSGLLHVNPATVHAGAYPLVDVVYAAVPKSDSKTMLSRYAELISYAAGAGQTTGSAPGNLPPGYLPLPSNLAQQAQSVAAELRTLAGTGPTSSPSPTTSPTTTQPAGNGSGTGTGGTATPTTTPGIAAQPSAPPCTASPSGTGASATPSASHTTTATPTAASTCTPEALGPTITPPTVQLVSGTTPKDTVGSIRWAIIIVVIAGLVSAGAGVLLRSARLPRMPWRRAKGAGP